MGYQNITINTGYSFCTVTFKDVASESADNVYDLTDVKVYKADGSAWGTGPTGLTKGALSVRKIDAEGFYGAEYYYISGKGWCDSTSTAIDRGKMFLKKGEGLIVYFKKAGNTSCLLQCSGEVELVDTSAILATGYNFTGNTTPVTVDLKNVQVKKVDGSEWGTGPTGLTKGALSVRKIDAEGFYGAEYYYISGKGWCDSTSTAIKADTFILNPGEGVIAYFKKTGATGCQIVMPNPIPAAE